MVKIEKCIWIFPFIGGIITLISFLTPAAHRIYRSPSFESDYYLWMCNLFISHRYETGIHTTEIKFDINLISLIPSIICSLLIIFFNITCIITANKYRKGVLNTKISWLVLAILTIITAIVWMVMMEVSRVILYGHTFWDIVSPNFGIIGPFLDAGLEIIGFVLTKKEKRKS